ncbi:GNAT family N-acetyltransferase [Liquorilactobacillus capillatus]|uniref:N-acetyltransferase domain-containing protein n=1 Tax=Liquorilactobacillus capillatus DSM 19910 TaxID=1423731 RepID=A0A0R1LXY4_9LACO|nr:GNAT family N-acetyltransferase [Liquorilactobacillus capillatus]KRL00462.1 hypothetical protein FC81_GL001991 [Liquorilactobacillus capillatus DSM 19910]
MLITKRLKIRRIEKSDLLDLYEYASQKDVAQEAQFTLCKTLVEARSFYQTLDNENTWVIEYSSESKVIGNLCLYNQTGEDSEPLFAKRIIGYALNADYWGQGIMTEALTGLIKWARENGITEIIGWVSEENRGSQRVLEKNGFQLVAKCKPNSFIRRTAVKVIYQYCKSFE